MSGSASAETVEAPTVDYYLPWSAGESHEISQRPGGSFSHRCPSRSCNAYDFRGAGWNVLASAPGVVVDVVRDAKGQTGKGGAGNYVKVQHADGLCSRYLHLEFDSVPARIQVGAAVAQGQVLGRTGNTGYTRPLGSGYHLHFSVADCDTNNSVPVDFVEQLPPAGVDAISLNTPNATGFTFEQLAGVNGSVVRLYAATFSRTPDLEGFVYWRYSDLSVSQMANLFITSDEWQTSYGQLNTDDFVSLIYRNVLEREPDQPGMDYWAGIADGQSRVSVLLGFSESAEFKAKTNTR